MSASPRKKAKRDRSEVTRESGEKVFRLVPSNGIEVHITPQDMLPKRPFTRKEGDIVRSDSSWTGGSVWYSSEMLARFLSSEPDRVRGKRVLELGSGCGLLGIVANALGAKSVTLTDEVLFVASHHVDGIFWEHPDLHRSITVQQLSWGIKKQIAAAGGPYDLIMMSDVLYSSYDFEPLADTIFALSKPCTCVLCAFPNNLCSDFFWHLEQHGLQIGQIPKPILDSLESGTGCDRGVVNITEMCMGMAW